ncbi:unnamed protein product [Onchocerca ochengi]|uniref:Secreted protein n=1 Tax=Onchocerca ochengi TaxID=42157 RepID=A0A182E4A3_ONCOC|nr:unnamed protein product [Onchocerca ochengi]
MEHATWLSTLMSSFHICMVANLPPSSADLLYKGHPSFLVTVLDTNARGYRLQHWIQCTASHSADENMGALTIIISWVLPECKTVLIA